MTGLRKRAFAVATTLVSSMASSAIAQFPHFEPLDRQQFSHLLENARVAQADRALAHEVRQWHDRVLQELNDTIHQITRWQRTLGQVGQMPGFDEQTYAPDALTWDSQGAIAEALMELTWEIDDELVQRLAILVQPGLPEFLLREYVSTIRFDRVTQAIWQFQSVDENALIYAPRHVRDILRDAGISVQFLAANDALDIYQKYLDTVDDACWQSWLGYLYYYRDAAHNDGIMAERQRARDKGELAGIEWWIHNIRRFQYDRLNVRSSDGIERIGRSSWDAGIQISMRLPVEHALRLRFLLRQQILAPMMDESWPELMEWFADPHPSRQKRESIITMDTLMRGWERMYLSAFANGSGWRKQTDAYIEEQLNLIRECDDQLVVPYDEIGLKARAARQRAAESLQPILDYGRQMMQAGGNR